MFQVGMRATIINTPGWVLRKSSKDSYDDHLVGRAGTLEEPRPNSGKYGALFLRFDDPIPWNKGSLTKPKMKAGVHVYPEDISVRQDGWVELLTY